MSTGDPGRTGASLLRAMDAAWDGLHGRLDGLVDDEYRWEPSPRCWTVRHTEDGWRCDWADPDPVPAPVTTIAWRCWHLAVDALDSYSARLFGAGGSGFEGRGWTPLADQGVQAMGRSWATFRGGVAGWTEDRLHAPLGAAWGAYADATHLDLALHALREVTHHGAEIALLRDLFGSCEPG